MYTNNRNAYRQAFYTAWQKYQKKLPLDALEQQIVAVIIDHPEYHLFLDKSSQFEKQEFEMEENPFFHLSLHIALREQIKMNRPTGITACYQQLVDKYGDKLEVEHRMMQCLAEILQIAERQGAMPEESVYLAELKKL